MQRVEVANLLIRQCVGSSATRDYRRGHNFKSQIRSWLAPIFLILACASLAANICAVQARAEENWDSVVQAMSAKIEQIPDQYASGDLEALNTSIRQAYYENYQTSGLEDQIKHRLSTERSDAFVKELLDLRTQANNEVSQSEIEESVAKVVDTLKTNVADLADAPELHDQWTRVANNIVELLEKAKGDYQSGKYDDAYLAATEAYLAQYEANGLEKATISYIGQSRVSQLEALYADLRQIAKAQSETASEYAAIADELAGYVLADATKLDELTSPDTELGWRGFFASFLILLREGAEALLVVAAVVTYALKANRPDQLRGILVGVLAALAISAGLAVLFANLTASASSGLSQELIEGITGLLAVIMLIWVSNWILNKASGKRWEEYLERSAGEKAKAGGAFALALVAFLAVLREGSETVLFYLPIIAGAKTGGDHVKIWLGLALAVAILAFLFFLVWRFGIKLPIKAFFKWTSVLLSVLAVTITGGAVKEFQDAAVISSHGIDGLPEISLLGIYPTMETLGIQLLVAALVVVLWIVQYRKLKNTSDKAEPSASSK